MSAQRYFVFSDIHLTVPCAWSAFRDHEALGACLEHLAGLPQHTVILAGDTFDFLLLADYEGFDPARSADRMAAILDHPASAPVLAGLRALVRRGHRLALLAGNHDPEVLQTSVRKLFGARVGLTELELGGDVLLHEPPGLPPVHGRRIDAGQQFGFVVHGDRWDVANYIDRTAFRRAAEAGEKFRLPPGSRLVYRILRKLKHERRDWVDQVKPEIESVLPLLLYLDWPLVWDILKKDYLLTANLLCGRLRARLGWVNLGDAGPPRGGPNVPEELDAFVEALRDALPEAERDDLLRTLAGAEVLAPPRPRPGAATLADHAGFWRWLLRAWLMRSRRRSRFFAEDADDELSDVFAPSLPPGLDLLVAGHTHGPRHVAGTPTYLNSGTWTPVGPLPDDEIEAVIDELERGKLPTAESPRTLVEITAGTALTAKLRMWRGGGLV